tara:strand:- start:665 stop:1591 length:927 start_codon:yes stop_codon:yes gene_type:complete
MINTTLKLFSYNELFNHFVNLDIKKKLPSRILLAGQEGIGKTSFALHLVNYFFSQNEITKYDVNNTIINKNSVSYNLVNNLSHPNFFYISRNQEKKFIEIDQIRNMINFLNKSSFNSNKKIILIDSVEDLNTNSSNALLKSLEESNSQNIFILTYNLNKHIPDTIKSRCLTFKLNFNYKELSNVIKEHFDCDFYSDLNDDFKSIILSPKFLIDHITFINDNNLDLKSQDAETTIRHIVNNKLYKKNLFISNYFQSYIEIYFTKMYSKTKDYKYYDFFINSVTEHNLMNKYNLDLDSFFLKFDQKFLNN